MVNRRYFFGVLAGGAGAAAVGITRSLTGAPADERVNASETAMSDLGARISMGQYTSDAFKSRVGQVFSFHRTADANDPPIQLELVDVQSSAHQAKAGTRQPFSLLFALRGGDATPESTLHLRHEEFEPCAWFVNRVVAREHEHHMPYYEAVFG